MKKLLKIFIMIISHAYGQGYNHQWLLGSYNFFQDPKGRMLFNSNNYSLMNENRKMVFKGTQANISDANGNLLMSSNGVWIADATGDTMMNGSGLNPGIFVNNWPFGFPINNSSIILNFLTDSTKYILLHKTLWGQFAISITGFYQSIIDMTLNGGLGSVTVKNDTILADTLSWGVGACKHANGRDWWVIVIKDGNPYAYTYLVTPNGVDTSFIQSLNFQANTYGNVSPIVFSSDGKKMIYCTPVNQGSNGTVLLLDFNRCTGLLSNLKTYPVSTNNYLFGISFSPSGKYIYACSSNYIFQIDTDNNLVDTVAVYDGFISPVGSSCCATTFWGIYLAANGKIYITSGSGVQHLHEMNYPDSAGIACDVQQHAINLGYAQLRSVPNHPNYYLGCDTSQTTCLCLTGVAEQGKHDFKFSISPNPTNGSFKIIYLLPQNRSGVFEVYDVHGRKVYKQNLPPWSTLQWITLPEVSEGIYSGVIKSGVEIASKKIVLIKE
jgi:hypothetical protein